MQRDDNNVWCMHDKTEALADKKILSTIPNQSDYSAFLVSFLISAAQLIERIKEQCKICLFS